METTTIHSPFNPKHPDLGRASWKIGLAVLDNIYVLSKDPTNSEITYQVLNPFQGKVIESGKVADFKGATGTNLINYNGGILVVFQDYYTSTINQITYKNGVWSEPVQLPNEWKAKEGPCVAAYGESIYYCWLDTETSEVCLGSYHTVTDKYTLLTKGLESGITSLVPPAILPYTSYRNGQQIVDLMVVFTDVDTHSPEKYPITNYMKWGISETWHSQVGTLPDAYATKWALDLIQYDPTHILCSARGYNEDDFFVTTRKYLIDTDDTPGKWSKRGSPDFGKIDLVGPPSLITFGNYVFVFYMEQGTSATKYKIYPIT